MNESQETNTSEILLYSEADGRLKVQVRFQDQTVWLTQKAMAELYDIGVGTVNHHIKEVYSEGELTPEATIRQYRIVQNEGGRRVERQVEHYSLDMILAVGYRVRSGRGTAFRQWATERLREYLVKGFTMDDERLKQAGNGNYFDELLARIRDIRSSEKVFWRKVLDIYSTSVDYNPHVEESKAFFATIQNKMHWAAHGQTAAEVIYGRADAEKPNMGMTHWNGAVIRKSEAAVAKNYLSEAELDVLNRIVTAYLEFAELQALNRKPMRMKDWIVKLDDFLKISDRNILSHAGKISHEQALEKANREYDAFHVKQLQEPTQVEKDFIEAEKEIKKIEREKKKSK